MILFDKHLRLKDCCDIWFLELRLALANETKKESKTQFRLLWLVKKRLYNIQNLLKEVPSC